MLATLELEASFPSGSQTGVFEIVGGSENAPWQRGHQTEMQYVLDSFAGTILATTTDFLLEGDPDRKGIHLDLGNGEHAIPLEWELATDLTKPGGEFPQWGSSPDPDAGPNLHTATGADAHTQAGVLQQYIMRGTFDSRTPAVLRMGEWAPDGVFDELNGTIKNPDLTEREAGKVSCSIRFVTTQSTDQIIDAINREDF